MEGSAHRRFVCLALVFATTKPHRSENRDVDAPPTWLRTIEPDGVAPAPPGGGFSLLDAVVLPTGPQTFYPRDDSATTPPATPNGATTIQFTATTRLPECRLPADGCEAPEAVEEAMTGSRYCELHNN